MTNKKKHSGYATLFPNPNPSMLPKKQPKKAVSGYVTLSPPAPRHATTVGLQANLTGVPSSSENASLPTPRHSSKKSLPRTKAKVEKPNLPVPGAYITNLPTVRKTKAAIKSKQQSKLPLQSRIPPQSKLPTQSKLPSTMSKVSGKSIRKSKLTLKAGQSVSRFPMKSQAVDDGTCPMQSKKISAKSGMPKNVAKKMTEQERKKIRRRRYIIFSIITLIILLSIVATVLVLFATKAPEKRQTTLVQRNTTSEVKKTTRKMTKALTITDTTPKRTTTTTKLFRTTKRRMKAKPEPKPVPRTKKKHMTTTKPIVLYTNISDLCTTTYGDCYYHWSMFVTNCTIVECDTVKMEVGHRNLVSPGEKLKHFTLGFFLSVTSKTTVIPPDNTPCENDNGIGICLSGKCNQLSNTQPLDEYKKSQRPIDGGLSAFSSTFKGCVSVDKDSPLANELTKEIYTADRCSSNCPSYHIKYRSCIKPRPAFGGKHCFAFETMGTRKRIILTASGKPLDIIACPECLKRDTQWPLSMPMNCSEPQCHLYRGDYGLKNQAGEDEYAATDFRTCCSGSSKKVGLCLLGTCIPP